jgi:chromate transport protein ChrA
MASPPGSAIFYAVLIAPGFVAVMTAISLAAIEDDIKQFVLLIWSLVSSLLIDTLFIAVYQLLMEPITSSVQFQSILFDPAFRTDYILLIFGTSLFVGILYAAAILVDLPGILRDILQAKMQISYSRRQPWEEFLKHANQVMVKTSDNQTYIGNVIGWSRAGQEKELRVSDPKRYNKDIKDFEPVGGPEQFFRDDNIERITVLKTDQFLPIRTLVKRKLVTWANWLNF